MAVERIFVRGDSGSHTAAIVADNGLMCRGSYSAHFSTTVLNRAVENLAFVSSVSTNPSFACWRLVGKEPVFCDLERENGQHLPGHRQTSDHTVSKAIRCAQGLKLHSSTPTG